MYDVWENNLIIRPTQPNSFPSGFDRNAIVREIFQEIIDFDTRLIFSQILIQESIEEFRRLEANRRVDWNYRWKSDQNFESSKRNKQELEKNRKPDKDLESTAEICKILKIQSRGLRN